MHDFVVHQITETETRPVQLAEAIGELGRLYLAYELSGPAEQCLLVAARLAPRNFSWIYHLGYLTQGAGRLDEAATYYERALALVPGVGPAKIRLGQVYAAQNKPERAEWVLRDALGADPASAAAEATLGELLVAQKRYREGEQLLLSALDRQPGANRLYYPLALALRDRGEEQAARAMMAKRGTVGVRPADPLIDGLAELAIGERVHLLRGQAAYRAGRFEEAAAEFRGAIEIKPSAVSGHINLGSTLGHLGDTDGAIAEYRTAIELAPANSTALYNLGALLRQRGELADALDQFRNAALYAPEDGGIRFQLADALRLTGRAAESLIHYQKSAELEPPGELARFREAQVLSDMGRDDVAIRRLEEGLTIVPRSSLMALTLARLLASSPDLSLRDGQRALEILGKSPIRRSIRSFETLAMAHAEAGECDQAVNWQSQAWEASLDFDEQTLAEQLKSTLDHYQNDRPCRYLTDSDPVVDPASGG
jgi:tetratricopeptide (TPR) repeat protein